MPTKRPSNRRPIERPVGTVFDLESEPQGTTDDEISEEPEDLARRYLEDATEAPAPDGRRSRVRTPATEEPFSTEPLPADLED